MDKFIVLLHKQEKAVIGHVVFQTVGDSMAYRRCVESRTSTCFRVGVVEQISKLASVGRGNPTGSTENLWLVGYSLVGMWLSIGRGWPLPLSTLVGSNPMISGTQRSDCIPRGLIDRVLEDDTLLLILWSVLCRDMVWHSVRGYTVKECTLCDLITVPRSSCINMESVTHR